MWRLMFSCSSLQHSMPLSVSWYYGLKVCISPLSIPEVLNPSVAGFGDGTSKEVIEMNPDEPTAPTSTSTVTLCEALEGRPGGAKARLLAHVNPQAGSTCCAVSPGVRQCCSAVADLENMAQHRRSAHGRRRKIKRDITGVPKKGVAGLRPDWDANTVHLARESSADGADSVPAQSGASVQSSSVRPLTSVDGQLTSPATPSPDAGTSLEDSFAHLQLGGDSIAERSHRGEGEEEHESPSSGRVPAPDTSIEETESDASSDSEDVSALVAQHSLTQQRLLVPNPSQTVSDRSVAAGGTVSVRSRRPDGQCTVTEV
ncbi:PREDICTED: E3 ubiquitin-protein ligase RNF146-B-like [Bison bison bison]|uniref:E3 ubiquitin-protein ligase RNF146-B-like n=1 Tax=Bison bison bison TaxID=43346 RepID=A0A6P3H536_BISBB|nr:PREDICTED: E3 ubiquitin-protein ligase RNF146-B-like [Bison bison bison]